jgi:hypothetical protein
MPAHAVGHHDPARARARAALAVRDPGCSRAGARCRRSRRSRFGWDRRIIVRTPARRRRSGSDRPAGA